LIWLIRDFDLLAVLLHAVTFSMEALVVGGVLFLVCIAPPVGDDEEPQAACRRLLFWSAIAMALAELASMAVSAVVLSQGSGLTLHDLASASFLRAEAVSVVLSLLIALAARWRLVAWLMLPFALGLVASTVALSHAVARMDHRLLLASFTAAHHLGTDAWIGAMPYLLLVLRRTKDAITSAGDRHETIVRRFSVMAMVGVAVLVGAGVGMAWFYVGSWDGLYGTSYGVLLLAKIYLLGLMLTLGAANWYLLRSASALPVSLIQRLRRFSEVEIGIGFTVLLAAASLTSQPPAVDVTHERATRADYAERMGPQLGRPDWPRLKSPPITALVAPTPIRQAIEEQQFSGLSPSDANDMAWSEYNHHWAGLVVLGAGLLALLSRFQRWRWARYWPLAFIGLAFFILLRADPEAWPLGPRPFWASFSAPDTLLHRLSALLIALFAVFECGVQARWLRARWAPFVFPGVCALGAALLLTHAHGSDNMKDEVLANASHTLIAVFGVTAGWARWLELRLPQSRAHRIAGYIWPVALMLAAAVLVDYREA
jgi:copper resistance protein D